MSEVKRFREKPIEAMQWTGEDKDIAKILEWTNHRAFVNNYPDESNALYLRQPVGNKVTIAAVAQDDWIIKGHDSETFYVCPAGLFVLKYEEVAE